MYHNAWNEGVHPVFESVTLVVEAIQHHRGRSHEPPFVVERSNQHILLVHGAYQRWCRWTHTTTYHFNENVIIILRQQSLGRIVIIVIVGHRLRSSKDIWFQTTCPRISLALICSVTFKSFTCIRFWAES